MQHGPLLNAVGGHPIMLIRTNDPAEIKRLIELHAAAIVDFSTEWCGPCKMLAEDLKEVEQKYGDTVAVIKVDKDIVAGRKQSEGQVAEADFAEILPFYSDVHALGGVPVIVFFKDGVRIDKILDAGEQMKGAIFGYIPGVKSPGNTSISIEEIMAREKMIPGIKAPEKPVSIKAKSKKSKKK